MYHNGFLHLFFRFFGYEKGAIFRIKVSVYGFLSAN